jgi:hypothetical protein
MARNASRKIIPRTLDDTTDVRIATAEARRRSSVLLFRGTGVSAAAALRAAVRAAVREREPGRGPRDDEPAAHCLTHDHAGTRSHTLSARAPSPSRCRSRDCGSGCNFGCGSEALIDGTL